MALLHRTKQVGREVRRRGGKVIQISNIKGQWDLGYCSRRKRNFSTCMLNDHGRDDRKYIMSSLSN